MITRYRKNKYLIPSNGLKKLSFSLSLSLSLSLSARYPLTSGWNSGMEGGIFPHLRPVVSRRKCLVEVAGQGVFFMEDFSKSLLLRDYDAVFVFNRENGQYHTLVLSKKLFNVVPSNGTYEEGMEILAKYVLPEEREFFRRHTERDRILKLVDSVEKAVVQYRIRRDDGICLCRNLKFLPGDEKYILAALRDETDEVMEQIRDANILALKNSCINFIVSNLCENFMTVDVRTGMSTTVIGAGNGEMLPQQTFKEQILWFAENVVVPEERENYIQYFALDNLVARIKENGGGTVSMFCNVIYEDGRHELLIRSTLVKDTLDLRGEYVLLFAQDMTSIRKIEEANRQLMLTSRHDKLTGLLNRAAAEKLISEHLDLVGASSSYCFLLLDIDYFKSVNDRFGHLAGDSVLQYMGSSMRKSFRSGDVLCRWGGDEFVIFLRGVRSREIVRERLDALRARLLDCRAGEEPLSVTLSIGGAFGNGPSSLADLYSKADKALYQVKQQGRNGTVLE